jgi:hypothetical protein
MKAAGISYIVKGEGPFTRDMPEPSPDGWGVWCGHKNDWFNHSEGGAIHYETESEALTVQRGLQLLLPANSYEVRRHTPPLCCYGITGCTKGNTLHDCGKVRPEEC